MKIRNAFAIAIVGALLASAFAGITAVADTINVDDDRNVYITSNSLDDWTRYPGEQDVTFGVTWYNSGSDLTGTDDTGLTGVTSTFSATVRNEAGFTVTSPIEAWDTNSDTAGGTLSEWDWMSFWSYQLDIEPDAAPGIYNLTVTLDFTDSSGPASTTEYITFEIGQRANVGSIGGLIPGDYNKPVNVWVSENDDMVDVYLNITRPNSDFSWFGTSAATSSSFYPGNMPWNAAFAYTLSVSWMTDADIYTGTYTIEYTHDDGWNQVRCRETGEITFQVGHLAMIGMSSTTTSIDQGTGKVNFTLTITNTGTVDLFDIILFVDPASADFTFMPADHWEGDSTVSYASIEVGDISVGGDIDRFMTIGFSTYIPEGPHKLMFRFEGFYFDPDTASYRQVTSTWEGTPRYPTVNMAGNWIDLPPESSTVGGPFIMLDVVDTELDISLSSNEVLSVGGQLVDNILQMKIENYGFIDFDNVVLTMLTSGDSPFVNAVDSAAANSEPVIVPGPLDAGNAYYIEFHVTLSHDAEPGVYSIPVTVSAVNRDMGEAVETTLDARVTIRGVGPQLIITSHTPTKINPGANFVLTLTIENQGDDTARNVMLWSANGVMTATGNTEMNGDLEAPVPLASPIIVGDIAPGQSVTVEVEMRSNADMSGGHVYQVEFGVDYVDSYGYGPSTYYHTVAVKSNGMGGSSLGILFWALAILSIVAFIALIIFTFIWARKNWVPRKKKGSAAEYPPPPQPQ
jgi:hypothetical protein